MINFQNRQDNFSLGKLYGLQIIKLKKIAHIKPAEGFRHRLSGRFVVCNNQN